MNKVSTRVTLRFDLANSPSLTAEQKQCILDHLSTRISKKGVLRIVSQKTRSQAVNKVVALERFVELLQQALRRKPKRKAVTMPSAAKQKRIDDKKHRAQLKRERSWRFSLDD